MPKKDYQLELEHMDFWPHPGEHVAEACAHISGKPSYEEVARMLGVEEAPFALFLQGQGRVTADLAIRLSAAFGITPKFYMTLQANYDLWQQYQANKAEKRLLPASFTLTRAGGTREDR